MKVKAYWWIPFFFIYLTIISLVSGITTNSDVRAFIFENGDVHYAGFYIFMFYVGAMLFVSAFLASVTMAVAGHYSKR